MKGSLQAGTAKRGFAICGARLIIVLPCVFVVSLVLTGCAVHPGLETQSMAASQMERKDAFSAVPEAIKVIEPAASISKEQDLKINEIHILPSPLEFRGWLYLGLHSDFKIIVTFSEPLPKNLSPQDFSAGIGRLKISFSNINTAWEMETDIKCMEWEGFIQPPAPLKIFHRDTLLKEGPILIVDAERPLPPRDIRLGNVHNDSFTLRWAEDSLDVAHYLVYKQNLDENSWPKIPWTPEAPAMVIKGKPKGWYRIVAVDRAGNHSETVEFSISSPECLTITRSPEKACTNKMDFFKEHRQRFEE